MVESSGLRGYNAGRGFNEVDGENGLREWKEVAMYSGSVK